MKGIYIIGTSAGDLVGWTPETLAAALEQPLAEIGVVVKCRPNLSGVIEGLTVCGYSLCIVKDAGGGQYYTSPPMKGGQLAEVIQVLIDMEYNKKRNLL